MWIVQNAVIVAERIFWDFIYEDFFQGSFTFGKVPVPNDCQKGHLKSSHLNYSMYKKKNAALKGIKTFSRKCAFLFCFGMKLSNFLFMIGKNNLCYNIPE